MAGVDILLQTYDAVLCMADGIKSTTNFQHNSCGAQKDKAVVDFVSPVEVKEKKIVGMVKSPQIKAEAGVQ